MFVTSDCRESIALDIPSNLTAPFHGAAILKRYPSKAWKRCIPVCVVQSLRGEMGRGDNLGREEKHEKTLVYARGRKRDGNFGRRGRSDEGSSGGGEGR